MSANQRLFVLGLVVAILLCATLASAEPTLKTYVILSGTQGKGSTNFASMLGSSVTANYENIGVVIARSADPNFATLVKRLPGVGFVAQDFEVQWLPKEKAAVAADNVTGDGVNSEPYMGYQWALKAIHADETAAAGYLGTGARVAILDSGIITSQPDLAPNLNLALSKSFVPGEPDLNPPFGVFNHGTHVAGIIAAAINGRGIQGVAPEAEIVAVKVLSAATGSGSFADIISGIMYAAGPEVHADIINMSLGAFFPRVNAGGGGAGPLISALGRAVNYATAQGTLVIAAAGNDGSNLNAPVIYPDVCGSLKPCSVWQIPAQLGTTMAISATAPAGFVPGAFTGSFDYVASYTNYGQSVVDVAAPGGDSVYSVYDMVISPGAWTATTYSYYFADGTSMATPHVSGLAALLVGKYGKLPPDVLKAMIEQSADDLGKPGADPYYGKGRINAAKALGLQ